MKKLRRRRQFCTNDKRWNNGMMEYWNNGTVELINGKIARLTLLYINFEGVIPAKAGIQLRNTGFRVKPGMTSIRSTLFIS